MFLCFIILFTSCWTEEKMNIDIQIIIKYADAIEIDLINEIYTVFYDSKPPAKIKFRLTKNELENIIEQYYDLNLNSLPQKSNLTNKCDPFPSGVVFLTIKDKTKFQEIRIGSNCRGSFFSEVSRVERFINLIDETIKRKPEIKNAPKSDIFYVD